MKKVEIRLHGTYIGTTEMTLAEMQAAQNTGFTIVLK